MSGKSKLIPCFARLAFPRPSHPPCRTLPLHLSCQTRIRILSLASSYSCAILSSTPSPIISCPYPLYLCFPPSPLHLLPFSLLPNHQVYRAKFVVHIERLTKEKSSGATIPIGIHPSSLQITSIHLDGDRKALLARKDRKAGDSKKMETEETSA
jgi:hypothetical protein